MTIQKQQCLISWRGEQSHASERCLLKKIKSDNLCYIKEYSRSNGYTYQGYTLWNKKYKGYPHTGTEKV